MQLTRPHLQSETAIPAEGRTPTFSPHKIKKKSVIFLSVEFHFSLVLLDIVLVALFDILGENHITVFAHSLHAGLTLLESGLVLLVIIWKIFLKILSPLGKWLQFQHRSICRDERRLLNKEIVRRFVQNHILLLHHWCYVQSSKSTSSDKFILEVMVEKINRF